MVEMKFEDIFDVDEMEKLMDSLSKSFEVGMGIRTPEGDRLISDIHFCDFCRGIVQKSPIGRKQCEESDLILSANADGDTRICRCRSAGLIDAGIKLTVGDTHIATILVGQIRLKENDLSEEKYRRIAKSLNIDEEAYLEGINKIPVVSRQKFENILSSLKIIANQLSRLGYLNLLQKDTIKSFETKESDWKKDKQQFKMMAERDALTGLYNRSKFEEVMKKIEEESTGRVCIISGDANNLKLMNDVFGHEAGDSLLKYVSRKLTEVSKPSWYVARCGGDEYRVLMPDTSLEAALDYCKRVERNCKVVKALNLPISVALGAAEWDRENESIQECFNRADKEMYENKKHIKEKENLLDYIIDKLCERQYLSREIVEAAVQTAYDFSIHLGFDSEGARKVRSAMKYQDIGYIQLPESFMLLGQEIGEEELKEFKDHVNKGYKMALQFENTYKVAEIILYSHERWNGEGYPKGLKGVQIPMESRLIRIVKKYMLLTMGKNAPPVSHSEAVKYMKKYSGEKYDPDMLNWFIDYMEKRKAV